MWICVNPIAQKTIFCYMHFTSRTAKHEFSWQPVVRGIQRRTNRAERIIERPEVLTLLRGNIMTITYVVGKRTLFLHCVPIPEVGYCNELT